MAKKTLFNLDVVEKRLIRRKGNNKKTSDAQDMLNVLIEISVPDLPLFVARDLANMPPLSVNHFDISKFARDIDILRTELLLFKTAQEESTRRLTEIVQDAIKPPSHCH